MVGAGVLVVAALAVGAVLAFGGNDEGGGSPTPTVAVVAAATPTHPQATGQEANSTPTPAAGISPTIASSVNPSPTPRDEAPTEESSESTPVDETQPTPEPTEPSEPTVEPATGDFGALPPADVPSGGLGRDLTLSYELAIDASAVPTEAVVYRMVWQEWTADQVAQLAASLGLEGDVSGSDGNFRVETADGTLSVSGDSIQYVYRSRVQGGALEDDATLLAGASDWLQANGLVLSDIGPGSVISRDESGARVSAVFYSTDPETLLSVYPSARVTIGPGARVLEAYVIWPSGYESSSYGLRSLDDLLGDLQDGRAYIEADLSNVPGEGQITGTMTISSVSLAYSTAGSADSGQFLTPVMVFSGDATLSDSGMSIPVSVYVPAVYAQDEPRG